MSKAKAPRSRTILFADGEDLLRSVYEADARRAGFEVVVAADGTEAWREFARVQPDAVVTDLDLPGELSGAELIARLRGTSLGAVLPIVAVSPGDKSIRGLADAVIAHDVDDYLAKPVHGERLFWRLQELIEGRPIGVRGATGGAVAGAARPVVLDRSTDFLQGTLERVDVATLFFSFFATGRSGKLCLMHGRDVVQVWFQRGYPVYAESNQEATEFGHRLESRGLVAPAELAEARREWQDADRSLGVMLVARGALGARSLYREMTANVDELVLSLFGWREGHYYLEYAQQPAAFDPPEAVPLERTPTEYVLTGIRDCYDAARCRHLLEQAQGPLVVSDSAHFILREMADPYYYENVLAQLDRQVAARELLHRHPFDRDADAVAALVALWVVGGVLEAPQEAPRPVARRRSRKEEAARRLRAAVASATREHPDSRAAREERVRERMRARTGTAPGGVKSIMTALEKVSGEVAFESGMRMLSLRNYDAAIRSLDEAIRLAPHMPQYYPPLAQALLARPEGGPEELDRALKILKRAVAVDPDRGEPYHWLGVVLLRMGHRDEARLTLRRALDLGSAHDDETRTVLKGLS
jgi:CheY-like chemotaxis protein